MSDHFIVGWVDSTLSGVLRYQIEFIFVGDIFADCCANQWVLIEVVIFVSLSGKTGADVLTQNQEIVTE